MGAKATLSAQHEGLPALEARDVCKAFPGVQALSDVSLRVAVGTIYAIVGENGAGKSTLVKIAAGLLRPDEGEVVIRGRRLARYTPDEADRRGVAIVSQEPEHFAEVTVLENLFAGRWPTRVRGIVDWGRMREEALQLLEQMGIEVDLSARMGDVSLAHRQMIQIGRALLQDARVLILDEPTAPLGQDEVSALFSLVRRLAADGVAVIYISHRLEEVFELADTVTVLRDGRHVATSPVTDVTRDELVRLMVGAEVAQDYGDRPAPLETIDPPVLRLGGLASAGRFADVSLEVRPGEIIGLAGLAGCGRNELAHALGGALSIDAGTVHMNANKVRLKSPREARRHGIVLAPGDRPGRALILPMTVRENITLSILRRLGLGPFTHRARETQVAREHAGRLDVRTPSMEAATLTLSGGNQQKTSLARRLATRPKVLVLEEPTQGVDVGARAEIHDLLRELAADGIAILLVSSDANEILSLSHRVIVMHGGRVVGELSGEEATKEHIVDLAFGTGVKAKAVAAQGTRAAFRGGRELGLAAFLVVLSAVLALKSDQFLTGQNLHDMAVEWSHVLIVAAGLTMVILTAGIDISVGSMLAVCAISAGLLATRDVALPLVILASAGVGIGLGAVNGLGIAALGLPAIIMTLATLKIYRGLVFRLTTTGWITDLPDAFRALGTGTIGPVPIPVLAASVVTVLAALCLRYTTFGRSLYIVGNNATAAAHVGIRIRRTRFLVYAITGALVGLAAVVFAPQYRSIQTNAGELFELVVITAVVVGGTNIFGGRGTIGGAALGVALLAVIKSGLSLLGTSESDYWERCFQGSLVLLAVMTDFLRTRARRGGAEPGG